MWQCNFPGKRQLAQLAVLRARQQHVINQLVSHSWSAQAAKKHVTASEHGDGMCCFSFVASRSPYEYVIVWLTIRKL